MRGSFPSFLIYPCNPTAVSLDTAESFTKVILDAVEAEVPPPPRRTHKLGWCETAETSAAFTIAWNARKDAGRFMRVNARERTAWKTLRTACANLRAVIDAGLHAKSTLLKRRDYSPTTTSGVSTSI